MKTQRSILVFFVVISLLISNVSPAFAVPPQPSSLYGTVKVNGVNVSLGTPITAWVNGIQYASTVTTVYGSDSVYAVDVAGDDTSTPGELEGGRDGETIVFHIGDLVADQTARWTSGTNVGVNLTATSDNVAPIITGQSTLTTPEDTALTIVLANLTVTDPDNTYPDDFTLTVLSGTNYTFTGNTITPTVNFVGTLIVPVVVNDGTSNSDPYNLSVTVTAVNDAPVITGQAALTTPEDTALTIMLANLTVTDPDNTYPTGFTLTVLAGTNYTFTENTITPAVNFVGTLTVPVRVNDGTNNSNTYNLSVSVAAVNDAPVITGQATLTTPEDTALAITLANLTVTDPDNTYPTGFTLTVLAGTNYTFTGNTITPAANFVGTLTVPVRVNDGTNNSNTYNLSVDVTAVNDAPVITGQSTLTTPEDTALTIVLANLTVTDPDDAYPAGFTLTVLAGTNYTFTGNTITPATDFVGTLTVPVRVNDGEADSNTYNLTVTVTITNDPPVITGQTVLTTPEDTALTITLANLTVTDSDNTYPTGFTLTVLSGTNYTFTGNTITPAANFVGTLTVPVIVNDGINNSNTYNLSVGVTAVNDAPVITGQSTLTTPEDTALTITLANLTVTDPDNTYPTGFTLTVLAGTNYTFTGTTITPAANFVGTLTVPVRVNDGSSNSNTYNLSVSVTAVNDAPVITGQSTLTTPEDTALTITLANLTVTDPDNTYPTGFTLTVLAGTNYTFTGNTITPAVNFVGTLTVPVRVNDGAADSNTYNLTVSVTTANDPPVIIGQVALTTPEDTALTITLANLTVTDPDNTYPTGFTLTVLAGTNYTFTGNTITPAGNFFGSLTVPVIVNDGISNSNTYNLSVGVTAVNDAPVITGQATLTTPQNTALTITLANLTVTDPDNTYPTGFTLTVLAGTNYTYTGNTITPAADFVGTLTVPVRVNDGLTDSNTYNLSVGVTTPDSYTLTIINTNTGSGTVTSNPAGINCGATCSISVPQGTVVTLTAVGSTNYYHLSSWSGGGCTGSGTCAVTMNATTTVTANFEHSTFYDVPFDHPLHDYIERLYDEGYTAGCQVAGADLLFCPEDTMYRGESAVFMLRGLSGASYAPPVEPWNTFFDDWTGMDWAEKWAEGMWTEGLTAGCQYPATDPLRFCPYDLFTREQGAVFGLRIMHGKNYTPPNASGTVFTDVTDTTYWSTRWLEQAYLDGLLLRCDTDGGQPAICPTNNLSRSWAAFMVVEAKGW